LTPPHATNNNYSRLIQQPIQADTMCATSPDPTKARAQAAEPFDPAGQPGYVTSSALLDERGQLIIEHRGKRYQLRETRNGKLILTS
jgi:hemin uptake protein HemP